MSRYHKYLMIIVTVCLIAGCSGVQNTIGSSLVSQAASEYQVPLVMDYLFRADNMETIQLTGQEILDGQEANMQVQMAEGVSMDFHISRDSPSGTQIYATYDNLTFNLALNNIKSNVFDEEEAIPTYSYQMACYDFNRDGTKELIVAAGNHDDMLSIFVFEVDVALPVQYMCIPTNYILGYNIAYVNENNDICVPSPKGIKTYRYDIGAEDPEYAKISGPIKISVAYVTPEILQKYKTVERFVMHSDSTGLLVLPTKTLHDVSIAAIGFDPNTETHFISTNLYCTPEISTEKPLVFQAFLPDLAAFAIAYTDESGTEQVCGITESLQDGTLYLFEMGVVKG